MDTLTQTLSVPPNPEPGPGPGPGPNETFLQNEYSGLMSMVSTASTIMYSVLSGVTVLYGFFMTRLLGLGENQNELKSLFAIMLMLLPTIAALVLGQLTAASYLFHFRLASIAKQLGVSDFWCRWDDYINSFRKPRPRPGTTTRTFYGFPYYAGSSPMALVLGAGSLITVLAAFLMVGTWLFVLSIILAIFNLWLIHRSLNPIHVYEKIKQLTPLKL